MSDTSLVYNFLGRDELSETMRIVGESADKLWGKFDKLSGSKPGLVGLGVGIAALGVGAVSGLAVIGEDFERAFYKIQQSTGATGEKLEGLERDTRSVFSKTPASLDTVATAISTLNQKTGATGEPLRTMAEQFVQLSRITGVDVKESITSVTEAMNRWGVSTADQPARLDALFKLSQQTGVPISQLTDNMSKGGAALQQFGFSFDSAAAFMAKATKEGYNTDSMLAGLKKGLVTYAKGISDPTAALSELSARILAAGNDQSQLNIATSLFGKTSGPEVVAALKAGANSLQDFQLAGIKTSDMTSGIKKELHALSTSAVDPSKEIVNLVDQIRNLGSSSQANAVAIKVFGAKAGPEMAAAIRGGTLSVGDLTAMMQTAGGGIVDTAQKTMTFHDKVLLLKNEGMAALEPAAMKVVEALMKVADYLMKGSEWLGKHKEVAMALGIVLGVLAGAIMLGAIAQLAMNAAWLVSPIGLIVVGITLLALGFLYLWTHVAGFRVFWIVTWEILKTAALIVFDAVKLYIGFVINAFFFWRQVVEDVIHAVVKAFDWVKGAVVATKDWIVDKWNTIIDFLKGLPGKIKDAAVGMWDGIKDAFKDAINWLIDKWNGLHLKLPEIDTHIPGIGKIGGFELGTINIPRLAEGGIVPATPGGRLVRVAEGGRDEEIRPLGSGGSGGGTITVVHELRGDPLLQKIFEIVEVHGSGNVQAALGRRGA